MVQIGETIRLADTYLQIIEPIGNSAEILRVNVESEETSVPSQTKSYDLAVKYQLTVIEGPLLNQTFIVTHFPMKIGRDRQADIRIPDSDKSASRNHAELYSKHGKLAIRDTNSSQGTTVNGYDVDDRTLNKGDKIRIGSSFFLVEEVK